MYQGYYIALLYIVLGGCIGVLLGIDVFGIGVLGGGGAEKLPCRSVNMHN